MSDPTETAPWYGRSTANGQTLIVSGCQTDWREADMSIPGGWPMVNDGQGWRTDRDARRVPYSPHPDTPWIFNAHPGAEQTSPSKGDQVT